MTNDEEPEIYFDPKWVVAIRDDLIGEAWTEFVMNERPAALAKYLALGGEVTPDVREVLVLALIDSPKGKTGGSIPYRDWTTYLSIKEIQSRANLELKLSRISLADEGLKREFSLRQAQISFANRTGQELRRVQIQYDRGRKIDEQFQ